MKVELKLSGIDGVLDTLKSLPPEVVSKRGGPVLAALRKGGRLIQAAEKSNLQATLANATDADDAASTGLLMSSVVVSRGKAPPDGRGERVLVRIKRKTYARKGKPTTTLASAQLKEYGSQQQPAEPWIRPAFNAKAHEAISTIERELVKGIDRIVAKLAAKNKGK
jgi:HK97 gp10 family phage protein